MTSWVAVMQALMALRVAISVPASKVGSLASHPASPRPAHAASHAAASPVQRARRAVHSARIAWPRGMQAR